MAVKCLHIGPGGTGCICCFPAPGSKARKLEYRRAKKQDKKEAFKLEEMNSEELYKAGRTRAGNDIGGI